VLAITAGLCEVLLNVVISDDLVAISLDH
jgi:hypothetical protein